MSKFDIKIKQLLKEENTGLKQSQLKLLFTGKDVNNNITNALRRLTLNDVPAYAFPSELIEITHNTSIYNNDQIRLLLNQVTIPKINVPIAYINDTIAFTDFSNKDREKHKNDTALLEFHIMVENNTDAVINVTSNDMKIYLDGEEIKRFNEKYPHLLINLSPNQGIRCRCVAALSNGKVNSIWSGASNAWHYNTEDGIVLAIESQSQMDEYELLYKACLAYIFRLTRLKKIFKKRYKNKLVGNQLIIELDGEDWTTAGTINKIMQNHDKVIFSGVSKPDLLEDKMIIKIESVGNSLDIFYECIDTAISLFETMQEQILQLGKKYINYTEDKNVMMEYFKESIKID